MGPLHGYYGEGSQSTWKASGAALEYDQKAQRREQTSAVNTYGAHAHCNIDPQAKQQNSKRWSQIITLNIEAGGFFPDEEAQHGYVSGS